MYYMPFGLVCVGGHRASSPQCFAVRMLLTIEAEYVDLTCAKIKKYIFSEYIFIYLLSKRVT